MTKTLHRLVGFSLLLVAVGLLGACGSKSASPRVLVFTAIPDDDETLLREKYDPVADYLSEKLGVPVAYMPATSYPNAVDLFKNGDVHVAWFGGLTGVQARHVVPGARAIVQGREDPNFYSYFIAHESTGLTRSDEFPMGLEGKKFTFGSDSSTSGRLMPEYFILENTGKTPEEFFGQDNHFSGSHDRTVELVASGAFEAGAVNYTKYDQMVKDGLIDPEVCRVVWKTPLYADYNFTAHPAIDETFGAGTTDKLQAALIAMNDPALLEAFRRESLIAADNDDFAAIEELARKLDFVR